MDSELREELNSLLQAWKADFSRELEKNARRKDLVDTGDLIQSLDNISFKFLDNSVQIEVNIAPQGRFQDMKNLRGTKNKNKWGYSKLLAYKIGALEDDIIILLANHSKRKLLNSFKNGNI